ncbi:reverse transcriptase [Plakobranchus ocellatus]|uniref:Reverse transcriptase n=1 Tax=Plakobranchus ocellatus TaxID=259542 RepID=A0AAV3YBS5_9GAST|nr:reverse transcriptase [Plakobranchus ocellatus]
MKEVCRLLGIKQKTTTPYHPMCNGLVEMFNATLKTCFVAYAVSNLDSGTGTSTLFCLLTDRCHGSPRTLSHSSCCMGGLCEGPCISCVSFEESDVKSSYEYVLNLREHLDDTLKIAREEL